MRPVLLPLIALSLAACGAATSTPPPVTQQQTGAPSLEAALSATPGASSAPASAIPMRIPPVELAKHSTADDCWMALSGVVYDVTRAIPNHGGGDAILEGCGTDATTLFETRPMGTGTPHSERARGFLGGMRVGEYAP